jgi:hypothetical protein
LALRRLWCGTLARERMFQRWNESNRSTTPTGLSSAPTRKRRLFCTSISVESSLVCIGAAPVTCHHTHTHTHKHAHTHTHTHTHARARAALAGTRSRLRRRSHAPTGSVPEGSIGGSANHGSTARTTRGFGHCRGVAIRWCLVGNGELPSRKSLIGRGAMSMT